MADLAVGDPSVMDQAPPVAVPPNAPAVQSDDAAALKAKLELIQQDKQRQGETNKKLNEQLAEIKRQNDELQKKLLSGKTQRLEEAGEYERLWNEAKQTISQRELELQELQAQLQNVQTSAAQERLKAAALGKISNAGVIAPEQLYQLMAQNLREVDGQPVALNGGVEQPLGDYLAQLKNPGSGYEHFFSASGARGMGSAPGASASVAPGMANPWRPESFSVTQQFALQASNPELAAALQAEAARG
jgi:type II secretory pathway component PulM